MFDRLSGNSGIKTILSKLVAEGSVPHSLLFAGNEGTGKKQFALELARALVCRNPKAGVPCGICASCDRAGKFVFPKADDSKEEFEKIVFSEHPDVAMVIPRGRNILVDAVRDLEREANFRPFEAENRVFIIDDAEKMNDAASNALLKTLEEPPPNSHLFLITSQPDSLAATIRSRCQLLRFSPVSTREVERYLIAEKGFNADDAALAARLASGSVGRAVSTDLKKIREQRELMMGALQAILRDDDCRTLIRISEKLNDAANKDSYEDTLDILQALIRDAWLLRLGESEAMLVNGDLAGELGRLAKSVEPRRLADWQREIETMREGLAVNINRKIATDALFMQMAAP